MLITESQMNIGRTSSYDTMGLLDRMSYLTEAESVYAPAMVPVVENTRLHTNIIGLENLMSFAESNGIEDLGYALSLVCETSEVEPNSVSFSVNKYSIIEDSDIANMSSQIMDSGVGIYVKPLSSEDPAYIIGEAVLNHGIETGEFELFEQYCMNEELLPLDEEINFTKRWGISAKDIHRKNLMDAIVKERKKAGDTRSEADIRKEMEDNNSLMKNVAYWKKQPGRRPYHHSRSTTRKEIRGRRDFARSIDLKKIRNGGSAQVGIDLLDQYGRDVQERHGVGKDIVLPNTGKKVEPYEIEIAGKSKPNYSQIEIVRGNPNSSSARPTQKDFTANTPSTPKGGFDISRLGSKNIEVHKSDTSTNYQNPNGNNDTTQTEPSEDNNKTRKRNLRKLTGMTLRKKNQASSIADVVNSNNTTQPEPSSENKNATANEKKAEQESKQILDKAKTEWKSKPREWIAKKIAWLHDKAQEFNNKVREGGDKAHWYEKILSYITRAIAFLTRHLHNLVAEKGHEISDKEGSYSSFYKKKA